MYYIITFYVIHECIICVYMYVYMYVYTWSTHLHKFNVSCMKPEFWNSKAVELYNQPNEGTKKVLFTDAR